MWTTGLEATPKGTELGSSSSFALRLIKSEFEALLSIEHIFNTAPNPEMTHIAGNCTICGLEDGNPTPLNVAGSMWWDYDNKRLYRDAGGGAGVGNPIVSFVHGDLDLNSLLSATAHTNYVLVDGDTIQEVVTPTLEGLSINIAAYTDTKYVLSQKAHLSNITAHDLGTSQLDSFSDYLIGIDKFKTNNSTLFSGTPAIGYISSNLSTGRYAFWPYFAGNTNSAIRIRPMLNANPPEDYIGGLRIQQMATPSILLKVNRIVV